MSNVDRLYQTVPQLLNNLSSAANVKRRYVRRSTGFQRRTRRCVVMATRVKKPGIGSSCLMRRLPRLIRPAKCAEPRRADKAFTPHPAISNVLLTAIYPSGFASTGLSAACWRYSDHTAATTTSQQTKAGRQVRHVIICQPQRQHHTTAICAAALPRLNAICPPAAPNNSPPWHFAVTIFAVVLKGQIIPRKNKCKNKRRCFHAAEEKEHQRASTIIKSVTAAMRSGE